MTFREFTIDANLFSGPIKSEQDFKAATVWYSENALNRFKEHEVRKGTFGPLESRGFVGVTLKDYRYGRDKI